MREKESDRLKYEDIMILKSFEQFNGTGTEQADYGDWRKIFRDIASEIEVQKRNKAVTNLLDIYSILDNYIEENYIDIELDIIEYNNKFHVIMYNLDNNNLLFLITIEGKDIVVREFDGQYYQEKESY